MPLQSNRKSQLYILTVLILSAAVFIMSSPLTRTEEPERHFRLLTENFMSEAGAVVNSAMYNDYNTTQNLKDFADSFITHAKTKNINFYLVYLLVKNKDVTIYNKMDREVNITKKNGNVTLGVGNSTTLHASSLADNNIKLIIGEEYPFTIDPDITDLKAIFKTTAEDEIEVIVYS